MFHRVIIMAYLMPKHYIEIEQGNESSNENSIAIMLERYELMIKDLTDTFI